MASLLQFADQLTHTTTCTPDDNLQIGIGIGVGIGFGIGFLAAILLASIASVILVKQGFLEFHHRSADKSLGKYLLTLTEI